MTKEPIMIDDVDVVECECIIEDYQRANNFENKYEHIKNVCELGERGAEYYNLFCKDNPNCYYKQLKRKEQECDQLRGGQRDQNKVIKQLKADKETYMYQWEKQYDLCEYWQGQAEKYKQTLATIKELAKFQLKDDCKDFRILNCNINVIKQILQKCEVLKDG